MNHSFLKCQLYRRHILSLECENSLYVMFVRAMPLITHEGELLSVPLQLHTALKYLNVITRPFNKALCSDKFYCSTLMGLSV